MVQSLGGDKVKQAVLVSVQVPKGLGCQAGNKAKAQNFRGACRPGAKGKPELRCCAAARSSRRTSLINWLCWSVPGKFRGKTAKQDKNAAIAERSLTRIDEFSDIIKDNKN